VDLSLTGLRVQSIAVLEKDTQLEGELEFEEGKRLPLKCEVVWSNPPDHAGYVPAEMGLAILNPPPEYIDFHPSEVTESPCGSRRVAAV
jgi:hypothetical protein